MSTTVLHICFVQNMLCKLVYRSLSNYIVTSVIGLSYYNSLQFIILYLLIVRRLKEVCARYQSNIYFHSYQTDILLSSAAPLHMLWIISKAIHFPLKAGPRSGFCCSNLSKFSVFSSVLFTVLSLRHNKIIRFAPDLVGFSSPIFTVQ